jgi:hypothetical protein
MAVPCDIFKDKTTLERIYSSYHRKSFCEVIGAVRRLIDRVSGDPTKHRDNHTRPGVRSCDAVIPHALLRNRQDADDLVQDVAERAIPRWAQRCFETQRSCMVQYSR